MFLIDKYVPTSFTDFEHNCKIFDVLNKMSRDNSLPHMIFYGKEGSGKKSIINIFLEKIYGPGVRNPTETIYYIKGSSNNIKPISVKQSNYHIVIEPNNNNFDKYIIQKIVKEYARRGPLLIGNNRVFRIVLINNLDKLSYYAQTSLRRTMEKFSTTCRFIMWTRSISRIIDPIKSRCYCFRISSPSENKLFKIFMNIDQYENFNYDFKIMNQIIQKSDYNIKKMLWITDLYKYNNTFENSYDIVINEIISILKEKNIFNLEKLRKCVYSILKTNFNSTKIVKDITIKMTTDPTLSSKHKYKIVKNAAKYDYNLMLRRRDIIHIDAYLASVINILKNY